jgi:branched-chain amino acid aminotransferase
MSGDGDMDAVEHGGLAGQASISGERIAYLNGEYIKERDATISIYDRGFTMSDAAYDVARTYGHKPHKFEEHVERLYRSLRYLQIDPKVSPREMLDISLEVNRQNVQLLGPAGDHRMVWRVTRGVGKQLAGPGGPGGSTVLVHNDPIPWDSWTQDYIDGGHLVVAGTRASDPQSVDPKGKLHSRLPHVLADLEAKRVDAAAIGLLLDGRGCIAEATKANFFMVSGGKLLTPQRGSALLGVTRATILELASTLGIEAIEQDLYVHDVYNADEVFLSVTSPFIQPISRVDTVPVRQPCPGPVTSQLIAAFSEQVGVDIVQQALHNRSPSRGDR